MYKLINRRSLLKGLVAGLGGAVFIGGASYYYSKLKHLQHKPLIIGGSTIVKRFVDILAKAFVSKYENVDLLSEGGHSYGGLVALERGSVDIAMMSHDLEPEENKLSLHSYLVGKEAVSIVVNPNMPIDSISFGDACKVFEHKIVNWKELGGPDAPIVVFSREDGSTTKISIEGILLSGKSIYQRAKQLSSSREMAQEIGLTPFSIGFLSARQIVPTVKSLKIDDIEANDKTVLLNIYPLVRDLFLVNRDDSSETSKQFIEYALSNEGQTLIAESGVVRVR